MDFKFRPINNRIVSLPSNRDQFGSKLGLLMWMFSTYYYKVHSYSHNKNMANLVTFSVLSLYASWNISKAIFDDPYYYAAKWNNQNELNHQKDLTNL